MREEYRELISLIKEDVSQTNSLMLSEINFEVVMLLWRTGQKLIASKFYEYDDRHRLIAELQAEMADYTPYTRMTFDSGNVQAMILFARDYPDKKLVEEVFTKLPWELTSYLLKRVRCRDRDSYIASALHHNWTLAELTEAVESRGAETGPEIEIGIIG